MIPTKAYAPTANAPEGSAAPSKSWSVAALVQALNDALNARFNPVTVAGEISGFSRAASGHCYFSIKDASGQAQMRCAMFKRAAGLIDFSPRDGDAVELRGRIETYAPRGDVQIIVESLKRAGAGTLWEQFERLKAKLQAEGWFDADRKRPLPSFVQHVAVVTSSGAAALQDVLSALARRSPHVRITLVPTLVQGQGAPEQIAAALAATNRIENLDAVLLVRGGGSLEDLWAFNDERVVRAIADCAAPVVSGVGHETDFTLADFVADLRAPTPTAAAELVSVATAQWLGGIDALQERLQRALQANLDEAAQRLDDAAARLSRPSALVQSQHVRLARLQQQLASSLLLKIEQRRATLRWASAQLTQQLPIRTTAVGRQLKALEQQLHMLNPLQVLQRGFALVQDESGRVVMQAEDQAPGSALRITLAQGQLSAKVLAKAES
jgi:exodeoxyribonuclease VII large subunit